MGNLNSEREECKVIKEEVQEGNKSPEEREGWRKKKGGAAF